MALARGTANVTDQYFGWYPHGWVGGLLAHLHSRWGYDEPEILRYSSRQFGLIGADGVQSVVMLLLETDQRKNVGISEYLNMFAKGSQRARILKSCSDSDSRIAAA
jgi:hypothetical protein